MEQGGGFVPIGFLVTQAPQFTLYGDGTVIFRQIDTRLSDPIGNPPLLPWMVGHMDEDAVQALLQYALDTGHLGVARSSYDDGTIADASSTFFIFNAGGLEKEVSIYALSEAQPGGPDAADRHGFVQLADLLNNFVDKAEPGTVAAIAPYDASLYRATLFDQVGEPVGEPIAWPWDDLTLADFPAGDEPGRVKVLTRAQVALLAEVPNGGQLGIAVTAPDGSIVQFGLRPLLPDEVAAFEAASAN